MERYNSNLVDEAVGFGGGGGGGGAVVVIEDCVETSGAFLIHHVIKRSLSVSAVVILVSFSHPFSHYDRILRKFGCNLAVQRDNKRFLFLDMLTVECPGGFVELYGKILEFVEANTLTDAKQSITVVIDDLSLMEVAANGSSNHILDFLHYCHTLTTEFDCSLLLLHHVDVYPSTEKPSLNLQIQNLVDVIIKAEPLTTGLASDVHGQLTVVNRGCFDGRENFGNKTNNFHFRVRENCVEYFYPGSRT